MNLTSSFIRVAAMQPDKVAVDDGTKRIRFGDLDDDSSRVASFLIDNGIAAGDRVGVFLPNCAEYVVIAFGVWKDGAVLVPFNVAATGGSLRHTVSDSGVRIVFSDAAGAARIRSDCLGLDVVEQMVGVAALGAKEGRFSAHWCYAEALEATPIPFPVTRLDSDNALLMYTSGSTGRPKGVQQTHRNTTTAVQATRDVWDLNENDGAVICTPFFHVGGMQLTTLPILMSGATMHCISQVGCRPVA